MTRFRAASVPNCCHNVHCTEVLSRSARTLRRIRAWFEMMSTVGPRELVTPGEGIIAIIVALCPGHRNSDLF